tara:strand:- start:343 stop:483 length:141 start_codon:yes stop_codon:yes gene_type:complete
MASPLWNQIFEMPRIVAPVARSDNFMKHSAIGHEPRQRPSLTYDAH